MPWTVRVWSFTLQFPICFLCRYDRSPDSVAAAGFSSVQRCPPAADNLQRQAVVRCSPLSLHAPCGWQTVCDRVVPTSG